MSTVSSCVLALFVLSAAFAATFDIFSKVQDKPGFCRKEDGTYIKEGEEGPGSIGQCIRVKCVNATPRYVSFSAVGCGTFVPTPGCHVGNYDNTKKYPDCCPREVCSGKA